MTANRPLGSSGLLVSPLGLGTASFGREVPAARARSIIGEYLDRGGNLVDVADSYADGAAETIVGQAIQARRDEVVISGKAGLPLEPGPDRTRASRRHLRLAVEGSLRRLGTDRIDLFHLHRWDDRAPIEETMSTVDDLVRQGKVGYVAVSNYSGWQLAWTRSVCERSGWEAPIAVQARYSLAARDAEREILPYCRWSRTGFIAFSPLLGGLLTGKYEAGQPFAPGSRAADEVLGESLRARMTERNVRLADRVRTTAADLGCTPAQLALAWLLRRNGICSAVVGVVGRDQLQDNLGALGLALDEETMTALDDASAVALGYPYDLLTELGCDGREAVAWS